MSEVKRQTTRCLLLYLEKPL